MRCAGAVDDDGGVEGTVIVDPNHGGAGGGRPRDVLPSGIADRLTVRSPHQSKQRSIEVVLSNSFGFGGTNASLIFRRLPA